ncbi:MAG: TatD family hydrolase [Candidatus Omnitrophica bacterium]|nr:TatD family hydrolase [Candidatus Omnitrophota bacterium]
MLIDSHCHLNSLSKLTREDVISSSKGKCRFIDSSIDLNSSKVSLETSSQNDFVYSALGFHPFSGKSFSQEVVREYEKLLNQNKKIVAIGEIGLDYKADSSVEMQEDILSTFIKLAKNRDLPIMIHNRWQDGKILDILDNFYSNYERIVFHCFSSGPDFLAKIIERKGFVSFSLNILRKKEEITQSLANCPRSNLLLETDSPYMRLSGKPSTPLDINKTYKVAAEIKGISEEELEEAVSLNAEKLFPEIFRG